MKRLFQSKLVIACSFVVLLALAMGGAGINTFAASPGPPSFVNSPGPPSFIHVCPGAPFGFARCHAIVLDNGLGGASSPSGYLPSDLQSAYKLPSSSRLGVTAISNSCGGWEYSREVTDQSAYNHPGIAITVSSGDSGYGVDFPAASQYVTAVGGTTLTRASNSRGWSETVWSGAGSGCSAYISKPSWQTDTGCSSKRTVADVAADADPNTGVSVYDSYSYQNLSGWLVFGGTSVGAPIIASFYALAGNASSTTYGSYPYSNTGGLFDVTSGSNGSCGGSYLCTGGPGYDRPTGNGTPNGIGAF